MRRVPGDAFSVARALMTSGLVLLLAGPIALAQSPAAQPAAEPQAASSQTPADQVRAAVKKLGDQTVAAFAVVEADKRRKLLAEAAPAFNFDEIGRGVLNYAGVKVPTSREPEVIEGLSAYVKRVMATELERIRPEKAQIGNVEMKGDAQAKVNLTLAGPQDQLAGEWLLRKDTTGWRVVDILVSGNSLTSHLGGKLSRQASGGLDQLIEFLKGEREKLQKQTAQRF